jgi:hypothetical protein
MSLILKIRDNPKVIRNLERENFRRQLHSAYVTTFRRSILNSMGISLLWLFNPFRIFGQ